jgi:hypothetical protein
MSRTLPQPGLALAVGLTLLVVGLQMTFSMPLAIFDAVAQHAGNRLPRVSQDPLAMGLVNLFAFGGAIALGLGLNRLRPAQAFPWVRVRLQAWVGALVTVVGCMILASELDNLFRWFLPPPQWLTDLMHQLFLHEGRPISRFFLLVLVAPFTEELLFRGLLFRGLLGRHRVWIAALVSAGLFAGAHLNPWQFSSALVLGVILSWFYLRTGSMALCIFGHAVANGLVMVATSLPVKIPGFNTAEAMSSVQFQPLWLDATGLGLVALGLWAVAGASSPWVPEQSPPQVLTPPVISGNPSGDDPPRPVDHS